MNSSITSIQDVVLILLVILMIGVAIMLFIIISQTKKATRLLVAQKTGIQQEEITFSNWWKRFQGTTVSVKDENTIMLDHDYDGIKELDNHLPPWWVNLFYGSIIFAVVYMLVYHVWDKAPLPAEEYEIAMTQAKKDAEANQAKAGNNIDEKSVKLTPDDKAAIANGKTIFDTNCMACHGLNGEGTVGPNLTDDFWLHGGSINDIFKTIKYGVPEKGMISWQTQIKPKDMQDVSNYIVSLHGTNPANAKAAEGEKYVPQESTAVATADSTAAK